jgi:hypothetical protein
MGLMEDRFEGKFEDHAVALVRTNLDKQVVVLVDDTQVASESVVLPHEWGKQKQFQVGSCGKQHTLVAHSTLKKLFGLLPIDNDYTVEIDGHAVVLTRTK